MSNIKTLMPDEQSLSTVFKPIPPEAPVTIAVFPLKLSSIKIVNIYLNILKKIIDLKKICI
mgnify:CR=1 FL=1